jgi:hypothetical protein
MRKDHFCYSFHILKNISLSVPLWAWKMFPFMKKPWESQKGKRAQETQWLGGMPKSEERLITKIKWVCLRKAEKEKKGVNQRRAVKEKTNDTKSRTADSDPQSLKPWNTLWALWILFFYSKKKSHSLHYIPVEVLSNQASKQPGLLSNALKMQRVLLY